MTAENLHRLLPLAVFALFFIIAAFRLRKSSSTQNEAIKLCREQNAVMKEALEEIKGLRSDLKDKAR